jgi:hypothetical protein
VGFRAKSLTLLVCLLGLLNGYGVMHLPAIPGSDAVQSRWDQVVDDYTHRLGCTVRQTRVLSVGEPTEDRLRALERYCAGSSGPASRDRSPRGPAGTRAAPGTRAVPPGARLSSRSRRRGWVLTAD